MYSRCIFAELDNGPCIRVFFSAVRSKNKLGVCARSDCEWSGRNLIMGTVIINSSHSFFCIMKMYDDFRLDPFLK